MITIKNVKNFEGKVMDYQAQSNSDQELDAEGKLMLFPSLTDPFVHLLHSIGGWKALNKAALKGGVTTLFTAPTAILSASNLTSLKQKLASISHQLEENGSPLTCRLYLGTNPVYFEQVGQVKQMVVGIFLSKRAQDQEGELDEKTISRICELAAMSDVIVTIDAKEEHAIKLSKPGENSLSLLEAALHYTERYGARLYVLNVGTVKELQLIQDYRDKGVLIYTAIAFDYLIAEHEEKKLLSSSYISQKEVNHQAILQALKLGKIDTIGSGFIDDASQKFSKLTYFFPALLTACHQKKISLEAVVELTRLNLEQILELPSLQDVLLVDLEKEKTLHSDEIETGLLGSHQTHLTLKGWPIYAIVKGQLLHLQEI